MAKTTDLSWVKDAVAKVNEAVEVLEESGKVKTELAAIKAEMARLEKDRDKIVEGMKKQVENEAKASAEKLIADAGFVAQRMVDKAQSEANAHYNGVKADAKRIYDQALADVKSQQAIYDKLNEQCADLQAELDDLHRDRDEALAKMRDLATKYTVAA